MVYGKKFASEFLCHCVVLIRFKMRLLGLAAVIKRALSNRKFIRIGNKKEWQTLLSNVPMMDTTESGTSEKREWKLEKDSELRFEVELQNEAQLLLTHGQAEIFGTELVKNRQYNFCSGDKIAVFTWHGCTLELQGQLEFAYVSSETPMVIYLNLHVAMEQRREKAGKSNPPSVGPKIMICGPTDVGKSTLCRLLLNYAVRMGRRPIYVDLDLGQGSIAIPGTVGALLVERPADVEEGFSLQTPLVYHHGGNNPGTNLSLYTTLVSKLSEVIHERFERKEKARISGCIINTCGWVVGEGFKLLLDTAGSFDVDAVLVIDQEKLYNQLKTKLSDKIQILYLPKSGGVVERSTEVRKNKRDERVREYFYGGKTPLYPHVFDISFNDVRIYKVGAPSVPDSCLPLGMEPENTDLKPVPVNPSRELLHCVCSVSTAESEQEVVTSNVAGFVVITNVDLDSRTYTILSPAPRPLPFKILLRSSIKFMDLK